MDNGAKSKTKPLSSKQRAFCLEYLKDYNATQAAIRAGYKAKTAYSIGSENLRKPEIIQEIANLEAELLPDKRLIIRETVKYLRSVQKKKRAKEADKLKACELLGKYTGMFAEKGQKDGEDTERILEETRRQFESAFAVYRGKY